MHLYKSQVNLVTQITTLPSRCMTSNPPHAAGAHGTPTLTRSLLRCPSGCPIVQPLVLVTPPSPPSAVSYVAGRVWTPVQLSFLLPRERTPLAPPYLPPTQARPLAMHHAQALPERRPWVAAITCPGERPICTSGPPGPVCPSLTCCHHTLLRGSSTDGSGLCPPGP